MNLGWSPTRRMAYLLVRVPPMEAGPRTALGPEEEVEMGSPGRGRDAPAGLRRRLFWSLFLSALIPAGLTLLGGSLVLRELVAQTGSAGPWAAVAESGRELLDLLRTSQASADLMAAAERHREVLSESLRLSQLYALVGERIIFLTPLAGLALLALVGVVAALATRKLASGLAAPAEELAEWIRRLGAGEPLPSPDETGHQREVAEFRALRTGLRDAAERLEEAHHRELEQARARSWSDMARRVAHEIKNPLMPMRMAAERVAGARDPALAEAGTILLEEVHRLDELARAFSQFGRPVEGPAAAVDLRELLQGLDRRLGLDDGLSLELPADPVWVMGHVEALERVFRNLVSNALEAQAVPGTSRPAGRSAHRPAPGPPSGTGSGSDGGYPVAPPSWGGEADAWNGEVKQSEPVRIRLLQAGNRARVVITDRGPGIDPDYLDRIWEPDFTTRRKGTGLGLPLVRQVVEHHGGRVTAGNRRDGGALFQVDLPLVAPPDGLDELRP